jgi:NTP pyrophosphatase (non-canonical NTP hydrolase)
VLEASEVLELFQWQENYSDKQALSEELADVFLYLLQIAKLTDINLEEAVVKKLAINYNRTWE